MRKVMLLAAMLAMVLAAAAPVFAQETEIEAEVNQTASQIGVVDDSVCSQVYNIAVQQYNAGDQTADADAIAGGATAEAEEGTAAAASVAEANAANIANATGLDINTVNVCLNNFATVTPTAETVTPKATVHAKKMATATATATADGGAAAGGGAAVLPETGGASLLALGAGALLVGGGLVARRIAR